MSVKKIDFSVLIPAYNTKPAELIEAVLSVLPCNQTIDQDYDVWVVDDGSTDIGTLAAMKFLQEGLKVKVITMPENRGTSAALNAGHEAIKTEYIAIMGSSDVSFKERFALQVSHLSVHPEIDVLGTNLFSFKESDKTRASIYQTSHKYITTLKERSEGWLTNHGTVIYKNQSVKDVGGYLLPGRYQDVDLWKRMALAGKKICTLADVTYAWRKANI